MWGFEMILVVTPLKSEFDILSKFFSGQGYEPEAVNLKTRAARFSGLPVLLAVGGHGKVQFGIVTQYLIDNCGPFEALVTAGTSGSIDACLKPGEVVIATDTVEHDYKIRFHGDRLPPRYSGSRDIREAISRAQVGKDPPLNDAE